MTIFNPLSGGKLALSVQDFLNHIDGYSFQQNATTISTSVLIDGYQSTNVENALGAIANELSSLQTTGRGFAAIPPGYDTYHNQFLTPDTPYDNSVPALNIALNDILYNTNNPLNSRIADGGIIFIPSGTYKITQTVNIPPGIIILGEGYGTKIINATSPSQPMFSITYDSTRIADGGVSVGQKFLFSREVKFINFIIADNFVVPKFLGDLSYKSPQNTSSANPLIFVQEGSHFSADKVTFVGKTVFSGSTLITATSIAIKTGNTGTITTGTIVDVNNCSFDGFSTAIDFGSLGGTNDYLTIGNNKIKFYGNLDGDISDFGGLACIRTSLCNVSINNNYIYGEGFGIVGIYLSSQVASTVPLQSKSKLLVNNNTFAVYKSSNSFQSFYSIAYDVAPDTSKYTLSAINNVNNSIDVYFDDIVNVVSSITNTDILFQTSDSFSITSPTINLMGENSGGIIVSGLFKTNNARYVNVNLASFDTAFSPIYNYSVSADDHYLTVNTSISSPPSGLQFAITLPAPEQGRLLTIKDIGGLAENYNIVLKPNGSESIEGLASNYYIASNFAVVNLFSDGTNWFLGN